MISSLVTANFIINLPSDILYEYISADSTIIIYGIMGSEQPPKYKKLNRETGKFEWVYPAQKEYKSDPLKPITLPKKNKKKWR